MKKISVEQSTLLSSPHLFAMVVSKDTKGKYNVMGLSWWSFTAYDPGSMMVSISQQGYTNEILKKTGKLTLCLPLEQISREAFECCSCSGRDVDKFSRFGLELESVEGFAIPTLKKSSVSWSLKVSQAIDVADQTVFLLDILSVVSLNEGPHLLAFEGYQRLDTVK
jgi:flavin reductase (DIM6/NTAB) family NADH-FMN oxidoreductase RutF